MIVAGLIAPGSESRHNVSPPGADYDDTIAALTPPERCLFDAFVHWDDRLYDLCSADFLGRPSVTKEQP